MIIYQKDNPYDYELKLIVDLFFTKNQVTYTDNVEQLNDQIKEGDYGLSVESIGLDEVQISLLERFSGKVLIERTLFVVVPGFKLQYKRLLYVYFESIASPLSKWGILVGIRPVKIIHELIDQGLATDAIKETMIQEYLVQPEKAQLLIETALRERPHLYPIDTNLVSLYLCIPFCPTRCLYCSFPSNEMKKKGKLLPEYLDLLIKELKVAVSEIKRSGKVIDCIYIGGGTPTTLNHDQLEKLLIEINQLISIEAVKEFSLEAGRPDTIDRKKLQLMEKYGVDRICINPQTMNDHTLKTIGRSHDSASIVDVMKMAREIGFKTVNMDVIMGLPGETEEETNETLEKLTEMAPENITVHTLSVKRASTLHASIDEVELAHDETVSKMLTDGERILRKAGYTPYYMYRQKKMIGHLENIGYAKKGHTSLYNMRIMEEKHTIVALGAGAVSKICFPEENRHQRVANLKGIEDYINRFDEILERKKAINEIK